MKRFLSLFIYIFLIQINYTQAQELTLEVIRTLEGHKKAVEVVVFNPSGSQLASGGHDGKICLWDAQTGSQIYELPAHGGIINHLEFSRSGQFLASASDDGLVRVWEVATGTHIKTFRNPEPRILNTAQKHRRGTEAYFVVFSIDEQQIYFGGRNAKITKAKLNIDEQPKVVVSEGPVITCAVISPDQRYLVYGAGKKVVFWDLQSEKKARTIDKNPAHINDIRFSNNGGILAAWCQSGIINLWGYPHQKTPFAAIKTVGNDYSHIAFSNNDEWLVSGNSPRFNLWDVKTQKLLTMGERQSGKLTTFAFNPANNELVTGNPDGTVKIWQPVLPCPSAGTACDDGNVTTQNDVEDGNCNCVGTPCPEAGTACDDGNPATQNDVQDGNCNCMGVPCPEAGTACDDGNPTTQNDVQDGNCNCGGVACPSAGTPCDDGNPATQNDVQDGQCNCGGAACPSAGTPCDDDNPTTQNDVQDGYCNCEGTCPSAGVPCDDGNPATQNDVQDGYCNCGGAPCPSAGTPCDDGNPATQNDVQDGQCNCTGVPCPEAGLICDDGNPTTQNDVQDGQCNCAGVPCPSAGTPCDDGNPATQNDTQDGQCNCTGKIPPPPPSRLKVVVADDGETKSIEGREVESKKDVHVTSEDVELQIWDDEHVDGDIVSLYLNGECILHNYELTRNKKSIFFNLKPNTTNSLVLYAHNTGKRPPNTAALGILDERRRVRKLHLSSTMDACEAVSILFYP